MASSNTSTPLTAESARPDERAEQQLPPKSFAHAVQQAPPTAADSRVESANVSNGINEASNKHHEGDVDNGEKDPGHRISVLRIVNTNGEVSGDKKMSDTNDGHDDRPQTPTKNSEKSERPTVERQESEHEYSATGVDESPKSPRRHKPRKSSQKSNGISPPEIGIEDTVIFEKYQDPRNGEKLISVKSKEHVSQLKLSKEEEKLRRDDEKSLVSGRQAGKNWQRSKIRFAPWNVPLQRRLQTLVVLFHSVCIALFVSIFFFLCAVPIFWPLMIPYMIYVMFSKAGTSGALSHRSNRLRGSSVWSLFGSYFPARLHRTQELPATRKYIFGYHPHGIISHGAFAAFCTEALGFSQLFPGITNTLLTLDSNFRIPIYRDYALAMGLASVSRESCENLLSRGGPNGEGMGRAITIVIGGARESLDAQPHTLRLVLRRRYGFVKLALRTGADLVPIMAFGENDLYEQVTSTSHPRVHKFQLLTKKILGFTIPLFHARGVFNYDVGLLPYRRPLNVVVGRPIKVKQSKKPSQEEINLLHENYITELERLWDLWKDDFAKDRKEDLKILE